jgi:hypothetical protein
MSRGSLRSARAAGIPTTLLASQVPKRSRATVPGTAPDHPVGVVGVGATIPPMRRVGNGEKEKVYSFLRIAVALHHRSSASE